MTEFNRIEYKQNYRVDLMLVCLKHVKAIMLNVRLGLLTSTIKRLGQFFNIGFMLVTEVERTLIS